MLIVGAGITGLVGGSATTHQSESPQKAIFTAVETSLGNKTADLRLSVAVDLPGGKQVTATGTGAVDFTDHETEATMVYAGDTALAGTPMSEVVTSGAVYLSIPGVAKLVPGKSRVGESVSDGTSTPGTSDPAEPFQIMESHGDVVTPEGPTTVGGVAVDAYRVSISRAAFEQRLAQVNMPASVKQAAGSMFGSKGIQLAVDVNGATDLLQQITFSTTLSINGVTVVEHGTEEYTNYGVPVSVSAPPPSQVVSLQQFEQAAAAAVAAARSTS